MSRVERVKVGLYERFTEAGRRRRDHRLYDERTFQIIDRVAGPRSNCVDVGCHEGLILQRILDRAPHGRHHAFEPLPELARALRERFPSVEVHEVALSDDVGRASFVHVVSNPGYSGLQERRYDRPHEELERIEVDVDTLDNRLPEDLPIALVKIDVEGAELGVLRGARRTLQRWTPVVVFEHGLGAADRYGTTPGAVYSLLVDEIGLRVSLLERYLSGRKPLDRDAFVREFTTGANYYFVAHPTGA